MDRPKTPITSPQQVHTIVTGIVPRGKPTELSENELYEKMESDMDINAGVVLHGVSAQSVGMHILDEVIAVASGKQSKSEAQGIGEEEFAPWILGAIM